MIQQTLYNHYWYDITEVTGFRFGMGQCSRPPKSYPDELVRTAKLVRENHGQDINLLMSGGVDSELVARAFLNAGIKFKPHIGKMTVGDRTVNHHDIKHAYQFLDSCGVQPITHRVPLDNSESKWWDYVKNHRVRTFRMLPQIELINRVSQWGGITILGDGGELHFSNKGGNWMFGQSELDVWWPEYARTHNLPVVQFLNYTPELFAAMLENPLLNRLIRNRYPEKKGTNSSKVHIFRYWFPDMRVRPIYHGFEQIEELVEDFNGKIKEQFDTGWRFHYMGYDDIMDMLHGSRLNLYDQPHYEPYELVEQYD